MENMYEPHCQNGPVYYTLSSVPTHYGNLPLQPAGMGRSCKIKLILHWDMLTWTTFFLPTCQMGLTLGSGPHGSLSKGRPSIPSDGPTWSARRSAQASPLFEQSSLKRESWNGWPTASLTYRKNSRGGHAPRSLSSLWSKASPARGR